VGSSCRHAGQLAGFSHGSGGTASRSSRRVVAVISMSLRVPVGLSRRMACTSRWSCEPGSKSLLPITVIAINEQVFRSFYLITEEEYQPGLATLAGGLELQFGVGQAPAGRAPASHTETR
jgi:hypothetical protein